jgi:DNA polymerase-3 subunit beta
MKIIINSYDLQNAIEKAEKVMRKAPLPILESVLIEAKDNAIKIAINNLESAIVINVDGYIEESGSFTIGKSNFKLIKKLGGELKISANNNEAEISANRNLKFKYYDPKGYPAIRTEVNKKAFDILESEFKAALKIKKFASIEENRPVLCGLCIQGNSLIGLNGWRMGMYGLDIENQCNKDIIIPIQAINELDKILKKNGNDKLSFDYFLEIKGIGDNAIESIPYLKVSGYNFEYYTRLVEGEYMKVKDFIPSDFETNVQVTKRDLQESLDFASDILKEANAGRKSDKLPVVFDIQDQFIINVVSEDKSMEEKLESEISGNPVKIGFDPFYMTDILKAIEDDKINMQFVSSVSPVVIKNDRELYLICPVRLVS